MPSDKHLEKLLKSKYHQDGGCVVRHESQRHARCKYVENGFDDLSNHHKQYNAPRYSVTDPRFEALTQKTLTRKQGGKKVKVKSPVKPLAASQKALWDVEETADGHNQNFLPLVRKGQGAHYPYFHSWHHLIASEMLNKYFEPATLLEVLMAADYNINDRENIVLLPKQHQVGEIIHWPIHPNNHSTYDAYVSEQLAPMRNSLLEGLAQKKLPHSLSKEELKNLKKELNDVSKVLRDQLDQLGQDQGGVHINNLKDYAASLG